jgi:hypothetical protein
MVASRARFSHWAVQWNAAQVDQPFVITLGAQQRIAHSSATKTTFPCREMVSDRSMISVHRDKLKALSRQLATHVVGMRPENLDDFLSQQFVFDGAKTVAQVVNEAASEAQGPIKITGFVRCGCKASPQAKYPFGLSSSKMVLVYCVKLQIRVRRRNRETPRKLRRGSRETDARLNAAHDVQPHTTVFFVSARPIKTNQIAHQ